MTCNYQQNTVNPTGNFDAPGMVMSLRVKIFDWHTSISGMNQKVNPKSEKLQAGPLRHDTTSSVCQDHSSEIEIVAGQKVS